MKKILSCLFLAAILLFSSHTVKSQWTSDASQNTLVYQASGDQVLPRVVTHHSGYTYVGWFSLTEGNYNVRLQLYNRDGYPQFGEMGLLVSSHTSMSWITDWDMIVDTDTTAILTFQDIRNGPNNVFAYRISRQGDFLWGENGVRLSDNNDLEAAPRAVQTHAGNYVIAWIQATTPQRIRAQKLDEAGNLLWGAQGISLSGQENITYPILVATGQDDVLMVYGKQSGAFWVPTKNFFVQRFDADGQAVWASELAVTTAGGIPGVQVPNVRPDGNGGLAMVWSSINQQDLYQTFMQWISAEGEPQFDQGGLNTGTTPNQHQIDADIAVAPQAEEFYVVWEERSANQGLRGVRANLVTPAGDLAWGAAGKSILPVAAGSSLNLSATALGDGVILNMLHKDTPTGMDMFVKAFRLDKSGEFIWGTQPLMLSTVNSPKGGLSVGQLVTGQLVMAWSDERGGQSGIFAQNLNLDGSLGIRSFQVNIYAEGEGEISPLPGNYEHAWGDVIELEAIPANGWIFAYWMLNEHMQDANPLFLTITDDMEITGVFEQHTVYYSLSLSAEPPEGGSVSGAGEYEAGTAIEVLAEPAADNLFLHWTDADNVVVSEEAAYSFIMPAEDLQLIAHFGPGVSVSSLSWDELSIWPNPATDQMWVFCPGITLLQLEVYDIQGRLLFSQTPYNGFTHQLDLSALPGGVYVLRLLAGEGNHSLRFVK